MQPVHSFLQTHKWLTFQKNLGKDCFEVIIDSSCPPTICIIEENLFGKFAYIPMGPNISYQSNKNLEVNQIKRLILEKYPDIFMIKMEFPILKENKECNTFLNIKLVESIRYIQAQKVWILNLKRLNDIEDILMMMKNQGMEKETRRLMLKDLGLIIKHGIDATLIDDFYQIMIKSSNEKKYKFAKPKEYFVKMIESLGDSVKIFVAYLENIPISAALYVINEKEVSYLYAGNLNEYKKYNGLYKIKLEVIKYACSIGIERFNFWGITDRKDSKWIGFSKFKKSFGGHVEEFINGKEIVIKRFPYILYQMQERYRKYMEKDKY